MFLLQDAFSYHIGLDLKWLLIGSLLRRVQSWSPENTHISHVPTNTWKEGQFPSISTPILPPLQLASLTFPCRPNFPEWVRCQYMATLNFSRWMQASDPWVLPLQETQFRALGLSLLMVPLWAWTYRTGLLCFSPRGGENSLHDHSSLQKNFLSNPLSTLIYQEPQSRLWTFYLGDKLVLW